MKTTLRLAILALLLAASTNAGAATKTWTGAVNNNWHEPGNWSPSGVPAGNATINIVGGSVDATPPVTLASGGRLNFTNSALSGALTIASGAVLNLGGDQTTSLSAAVTNAGLIRWSGVHLGGVSVIINQAGALFDAQSDHQIYYGSFLNAGEFRKSAGSGTTFIYATFANTGTVRADTGVISFHGGGEFAGTYHAAAGAAIELGAGQYTYTTLPTFPGPGAIQLNGATLTLLDNLMPGLQLLSGTLVLSPTFQGGTITNLSLSGITLSGNYTVSGTFNGSGVTLQGDLAIAGSATVNWVSGGSLSGNHTLASGGRLNFTNSALSGALTIASGAVLNLGGDQTTSLSAAVTNAGLIRWSGAHLGGVSVIINQAGALFDAQSDHQIYYGSFLNAGEFRKSAGSGTTFIYATFANTGTVRADTGTISFQSAFHQSPDATLAISIGGPNPGTDYGHISFAQPLVLDGSFTASARNGYLPNPGDTFNVLSYPSFTGEFSCLSGIVLGGGIVLFPAVHPKSMTLTAASATDGAPAIFASPWARGVRLIRPPGFSDWEFVTTTNLFAPVWIPVPVTGCPDQVTLPATTPEQYFRLRKSN